MQEKQIGVNDELEISVENREAIIREYAPMIKYVAGRIAMRLPPHIEVDDLVSVGVLGLFDAIQKYDPSRGAPSRPMPNFVCAAPSSTSCARSTGFPVRCGRRPRRSMP